MVGGMIIAASHFSYLIITYGVPPRKKNKRSIETNSFLLSGEPSNLLQSLPLFLFLLFTIFIIAIDPSININCRYYFFISFPLFSWLSFFFFIPFFLYNLASVYLVNSNLGHGTPTSKCIFSKWFYSFTKRIWRKR